jgi:ElaB/YqjD/DUF883 family membrane-anchored ribosome-binding protein
MPDVAFPPIDFNKAAEEFNNAVRDGLYVAVGLGVLGFQRAQVRRVELTKQIESQLGDLSSLPATLNARLEPYARVAREQLVGVRAQLEAARGQVTEIAKTLDEAVEPARRQLDDQVTRLEEQLPAGARSVLQTVRDAAASQEQLFRTAVGLD